tara:strand:- start:20249 stop:20755 length:507 start_codon:yes stop_codon:yes gene_type:complete
MSEISKDSINILEICGKMGMVYTSLIEEDEGQEYSASYCLVSDKKLFFRTSKVTPKKSGQFVTFWKRSSLNKKIEPYSNTDEFDLLVVIARKKRNLGYFIFPKHVLASKKILSNAGQDGKRAFRVYTPWDTVESKQARSTQEWQLEYFAESHSGQLNPKLHTLIKNCF